MKQPQRHHPKGRKKTPNTPKRKALGPKVRKLRRSQGWSQQTLARVAGMDDGHIGEIERSEIDPSLSTLLKIAKAFDLTLFKLLQTSRPS
ncbi:MAG TPA: helix-turn-helix transcriptional regulator, partial [Candidatus Angelobacter sp.]|nr:helix-turn-helix transcriptional regulator [Candidatus Angelobacter sp.]